MRRSQDPPELVRELGGWGKYHAWLRDQQAHRKKVGRNAPCPCGSGVKYKRCCWRKQYASSKA